MFCGEEWHDDGGGKDVLVTSNFFKLLANCGISFQKRVTKLCGGLVFS